MDQFPGNSQRQRTTPTEKKVVDEKNISPVVTGEVVRRKQPISKRIKEALLGGDTQSVKDHIILEVIVPSFKNMVADAAIGGIERAIYGQDYRPSRRARGFSSGPGGSFNYAGISKGPISEPRGRANDHALSKQARMLHNFDEIVFEHRSDLEMVLTQMFDLLDRFEAVTVADFYKLVGHSSSFADRKYGWTDLRGTRPAHVRGGWVLDLPPTEVLD